MSEQKWACECECHAGMGWIDVLACHAGMGWIDVLACHAGMDGLRCWRACAEVGGVHLICFRLLTMRALFRAGYRWRILWNHVPTHAVCSALRGKICCIATARFLKLLLKDARHCSVHLKPMCVSCRASPPKLAAVFVIFVHASQPFLFLCR